METRYATRSRAQRVEKKKKRHNRLKRHSNASSSGEESEVDEYGNIKGLIDYHYEPQQSQNDIRHKRSRKKKSKKRRNRRRVLLSTESETETVSMNDDDELLTKMLVLQELCNHVEEMKRQDYISSEESDSDYRTERSSSSLEDTDHLDDDYRIKKKSKGSLRRHLTRDELKYYKKLTRSQKASIEQKNKEIDSFNSEQMPLKFKILGLPNISTQCKSHLLSRLQTFQNMEQSDNEYHKLKSWFNEFTKLPLNQNVQFPISVESSSKGEIYNFLKDSRNVLDSAVYGHDPVKNEIIQVISQWITNPESKGNVLALQGPMGNGKTTLAKNGLAKVLKRPFALIALGGAKDSSFLNGHEYTFEGSKCGRIVEVLRDLQCMNPVIFFDELDKLSDTPNGQEISNLLCHITDPVQNSEFQDRYFSGIDFDLSKAIFVVSFNDESKVNTILKDRMHVVHMKGFKSSDKIKIARQYLIPEICQELNFKSEMVHISDDVLKFIVETFTKEEGCRSFRRCLKMIYSKLNVLNLLSDNDEKSIKEVISFELDSLDFPMTLTTDRARALLKSDNNKDKTSVHMMYM